ncbi:MAG: hypothetical protein HFH08_04690 [Bacilli bacterium]|nr:hypothetical protein [Bacilli bacterium]
MNFMNKFVRFMYGRYGSDEFNHFLFLGYLFCFIINLFFHKNWIFIVEMILVFTIFFRTFSKNIERRKKERQLFLKMKRYIRRPFETTMKNYKDKEHIYKKCYKCKTILRLPLPDKKGIKHTKCPTCKKKLIVFALKHQKIEIIRKKI